MRRFLSGDEAFAATARSMGGRVVAADGVDADLLRSLLTRRGRIAVETVQIIEERVPEALSTFAQIARVLDNAEPNPALVSRVQLRIDDPWAAENWRRTVTGTERTWLADALSATEQTARALVARLFPSPPRLDSHDRSARGVRASLRRSASASGAMSRNSST